MAATLVQPKYIPSPAEIEAATAVLRAAHLDAKLNEPSEEEDLEQARLRSRRYRQQQREMTKADIANVELISDDELCDAMGMLLDCVGYQTRANDLAARWELGDIDPELFDVSDEPAAPEPFKPRTRAAVRFRSSL